MTEYNVKNVTITYTTNRNRDRLLLGLKNKQCNKSK